jgi:hypothetical protein
MLPLCTEEAWGSLFRWLLLLPSRSPKADFHVTYLEPYDLVILTG